MRFWMGSFIEDLIKKSLGLTYCNLTGISTVTDAVLLPEQAPPAPPLLGSLRAPLQPGCTPQPLYRSLEWNTGRELVAVCSDTSLPQLHVGQLYFITAVIPEWRKDAAEGFVTLITRYRGQEVVTALGNAASLQKTKRF